MLKKSPPRTGRAPLLLLELVDWGVEDGEMEVEMPSRVLVEDRTELSGGGFAVSVVVSR